MRKPDGMQFPWKRGAVFVPCFVSSEIIARDSRTAGRSRGAHILSAVCMISRYTFGMCSASEQRTAVQIFLNDVDI